MKFLRSIRSARALIWVVMLSVAMLVTQNLQVHIHSVDHDPLETGRHDSTMTVADSHQHADVKHLSIDNSHADHHDAVIFEMDASPDRIHQLLSKKISPVDLLALCLILLFLGRYVVYRTTIRRSCSLLPRRRFHLIPALRAPPC